MSTAQRWPDTWRSNGRTAVVAALAGVSLFAGTLVGQGKRKPCDGGELRVRHAYSECRDRVWHVVEVGYYLCPPNNRIDEVELSARATERACDKGKPGAEIPWGLAADAFKDLSGDATCVNPTIDKPMILLECVAGFWSWSTYDFYKCADDTRRIKRPAARIDRTTTACSESPPKFTYKP